MTASADPTPLWNLAPGVQATVVGFDDGLSENYRVRLMEFGFHPGEVVTCLLSPGFGAPKVYRVSNTVFSLDSDIATKVLMATDSMMKGAAV